MIVHNRDARINKHESVDASKLLKHLHEAADEQGFAYMGSLKHAHDYEAISA